MSLAKRTDKKAASKTLSKLASDVTIRHLTTGSYNSNCWFCYLFNT